MLPKFPPVPSFPHSFLKSPSSTNLSATLSFPLLAPLLLRIPAYSPFPDDPPHPLYLSQAPCFACKILRPPKSLCMVGLPSTVVEMHLKECFKDIEGKISITFDSWTSGPSDPYLGVTAHYIDSPVENPHKWKLHSELIGFAPIEGNYGGSNTAVILMQVVGHYDFCSKFGWMTGDNIGVNDRAARRVQCAKGINTKDHPWKAHEHCGRCMEHTIHLGVKAFIEALNPTIGKKKPQATVEDNDSSGGDDNFNWDQLNAVPNNNEIDEPINFDPSDVLGKVLVLITHAIDKFCLLADSSTKVLNLMKKEYADYKLTSDEWEILGLIKEVLEVLPILEHLIKQWDNFVRLAKFEKIAHAIQKGLEKIQKWYNKTDDSNMYFICLGEFMYI
ncbi:hypothetical protein DXG01_016674 [Tephrocybe rancida]|nr:hypothetical protein DXG01_016674 [Tephrocybe rancida]